MREAASPPLTFNLRLWRILLETLIQAMAYFTTEPGPSAIRLRKIPDGPYRASTLFLFGRRAALAADARPHMTRFGNGNVELSLLGCAALRGQLGSIAVVVDDDFRHGELVALAACAKKTVSQKNRIFLNPPAPVDPKIILSKRR